MDVSVFNDTCEFRDASWQQQFDRRQEEIPNPEKFRFLGSV